VLSLIVDSVSLTIPYPALCPAIVPPPRYACLSTPSLPRHYPASSVIWVNPTTYAPSSGLVSSASRTHIAAGKHRSSQVPVKSLGQHAMDYDPGGVSAISPISMASLLSSVFLNHVDSLHSISIFGAEYLHPCGLRPTASLFTLHPHDYPYRCKTRF